MKPLSKASVKTIAIGSTNPVKINAVKQVLKPLYPQAKFVSLDVNSQVSHQPLTDQETRRGATNRVLAALKQTQADLAVGIEGGVMTIDKQLYSTAWVAIADKSGNLCLGGGLHFLLPPSIAQAIKQGGELGPLMDQLSGEKDSKKKNGSVSFLTNNLVTRTEAYVRLIQLALVKFRRPRLY